MSRAMQLLIREDKAQTPICQIQVWALSTLSRQQNFCTFYSEVSPLTKDQLVPFIRSILNACGLLEFDITFYSFPKS